MSWVWWIVIAILLIGFLWMLWSLCAANHVDDREDQIEWLRQEYARQKRKHEITFRESKPKSRRKF